MLCEAAEGSHLARQLLSIYSLTMQGEVEVMDMSQPWLQQCLALCGQIKHIGEEMLWTQRPNHEGSLAAQAVVLDGDYTTIPGVSFLGEVQYRRWGLYQSYGLLYRESGKGMRVVMLEVLPSHVRGHIDGDGEVRGSHVHYGDARGVEVSHAVRQVRSSIDPNSFRPWIKRFLRYATLREVEPYRIRAPFEGDLFG